MPKSDSQSKFSENPHEPIGLLCSLIQSISLLLIKENTEILHDRIRLIESTAKEVIRQFNHEESEILCHFEPWLIPFAKEILEQFYEEAHALNEDLLNRLNNANHSTPSNWIEHATQWAQLYSRWQDRRKLMESVLDLLSHKARRLIDHDIKIIEEYKNQGIENCSKQPNDLGKVKDRIFDAIKIPLNSLLEMKKNTEGPSSLLEAAKWLANFRERREGYFNESLTYIDEVIREMIGVSNEIHNLDFLNDIHGEFIFLEQELNHILDIFNNMDSFEHEDQVLLANQIESLKEILEKYESNDLPDDLKMKHAQLKLLLETINIDKWLIT